MKINKPRTKPIIGLIIFASIAVLVSLAGLIIFIIDRSNLFISILVYIFASLFIVGGLVVVLEQLGRYVEVKEDKLIYRNFLKKSVIPTSKIKKVSLNQGVYEVYIGKKKFCTFPSRVDGAAEIIIALARQGVEIDEK